MRKLIFLKKSSKQVVNTNFLKNNFSFINLISLLSFREYVNRNY